MEQKDSTEETKTDAAVEDIVAKESDELLAAEDKQLHQAFSNQPPSFRQKLKNFFKRWWDNPKARWSTIVGAAVLVMAMTLVPVTRYAVLNTLGVRSSSSVVVLDQSTLQPLKNVTVKLAGQQGTTDDNGRAQLSKLRLGRTTLTVEKRAFATESKPVTLGWGSNPLGEVNLRPTGTQYSFIVVDYLSGKPIPKAEAIGDQAEAFADEQGKIKLTVDKNAPASFEVIIKKDGLRDEKVQVTNDNTEARTVAMVSRHKHVFLSNRSGRYDVYKVDVDGANEELVLSGTGSERDDLALVPHPDNDLAALVSTRDNKHDGDGYLLSNLALIDLTDNSVSTLAESQRLQIVGWSGDNLIYAQIAAGASAANPKRHRLISYNTETKISKEIAAANYFNDVAFANGKLYYAPSSNNLGGGLAGLYQVSPDGSNRQTVMPQEVWNVFRTGYDRLVLSQPQGWYEYKLGNIIATKLPGEPSNTTNRLYVDSPDGKHSLWVDSRDGKGVLLNYELSSQKDSTLKTQSGLSNPVYWINDQTVIYRVRTPQETADYVMSIAGGQPRKLRDVSNAAGLSTWYYY